MITTQFGHWPSKILDSAVYISVPTANPSTRDQFAQNATAPQQRRSILKSPTLLVIMKNIPQLSLTTQ